MQELQNNLKHELEAVLGHATSLVAALHSSRATPALVEDIFVMAYDSKMPLKQVASLSTPDARTIVVQPWDTALLGDIQRAIAGAGLGMSSTAEEKCVRLTMPQLSEERRHEAIKTLGKIIEESRVTMRRARDRAMKTLEEKERGKEISEDEKFRTKDAVQKIIDGYMGKLSELESKKTEEIMK